MADTTFKTPEPVHEVGEKTLPDVKPPESVVVQTGPAPKTTNIPLEQYYSENDNNPYSEKFFKLDTPYTYLPSKVQQQLKSIDKFVETELADRGWKHSTHSYEQVLSDVMLELGTTDGEIIDQIERLSGYADNIIKLDGLDDIRKQIKHKLRRMQSPKDMSNLVLKEIGKRIV